MYSELYSKLHFFQTKNEQQKLELNELKMHCLKENENKKIISNQVEKMESELFLKKQSFNSLIKKISNGVSHSDEETINTLEVLFNMLKLCMSNSLILN